MVDDPTRNPLIIPVGPEIRRGCPECGHPEYEARNLSGVYRMTCKKCRFRWEGGLGQLPQDPRVPVPPENYVPPLRFESNSRGEQIEVRRRVNPTQDFRKGAPIPQGDE